jgi:hypothetical protein
MEASKKKGGPGIHLATAQSAGYYYVTTLNFLFPSRPKTLFHQKMARLTMDERKSW